MSEVTVSKAMASIVKPALRSLSWPSPVCCSLENICYRGLLNTLLCPWDICLLSHRKGQVVRLGVLPAKAPKAPAVGGTAAAAVKVTARIGVQTFPRNGSPAVSLAILGNGFKMSFLVWS